MKHILLLTVAMMALSFNAYSQNNGAEKAKTKAEERREARNLARNGNRNSNKNNNQNASGEISDPNKINAPISTKTTTVEDEKKKDVQEEPLNDKLNDDFNSNGVSPDAEVVEEDAETGTSIISYENILDAVKKENIAADVPVEGQKVKLMIQNNHPTAMWYLMPISGEKSMPNDGKFLVNPDAEIPFIAKKYEQGTGQLVELIYHGQDGQSFRAFYVEAGSSMLFRNYDLGSYAQGDVVPFWSAKELHINSEILLENWLPFSVKSSPDVVLHNNTESGQAKWVNMCKEAKFPTSKIQFVLANHIKRYQIPVGLTN
jgi:hypothetical protein